MSEANREVTKPEMMKSNIWLQRADGSLQQVEQGVAKFCPTICHEMHKGRGSSKNYPISLPPRVNTEMWTLILEYCRFNQVSGLSDKERKSFNHKNFNRMDIYCLQDLASAAASLQFQSLVFHIRVILALRLQNSTPEEIHKIFQLRDDLTEEEKLEPLRNFDDDIYVKLWNKLLARKREKVKERESAKNVKVEEERVDDRSIDDLVAFINGGNGDSKRGRTTKTIKKNKRRKDQQNDTCSTSAASLTDVSSSNNGIQDSKMVKTTKTKKKNKRRKDQQSDTCSTSAASLTDISSSNNGIEIHKDSNEPDSVGHYVQMHNLIQPNIDERPDDEFDDGNIDPEDSNKPDSVGHIVQMHNLIQPNIDERLDDEFDDCDIGPEDSNVPDSISHNIQMHNLIQPNIDERPDDEFDDRNIDPEDSNEPYAADDEYDDGDDSESDRVVNEFIRRQNLTWQEILEEEYYKEASTII